MINALWALTGPDDDTAHKAAKAERKGTSEASSQKRARHSGVLHF